MPQDLFTPLTLGNMVLKNRIVLAPLTRCRAKPDGVPSELAPLYYTQRASAGLLISEATPISAEGTGYIRTPGIYTAEHIRGWQKVTTAVHGVGGKIFLQLWHVGRVSHPDFHQGKLPVAPSAVGFVGESYTPEGFKKVVTPRALELSDIERIIDQYRVAAQNAQEAGFDGVEVHGANGYLPDQFLHDGSNQRTDRYGGSLENRARFLLEVTAAVVDVWGSKRVGVRVSPSGVLFGMQDSDPETLFSYVLRELAKFDLAYLHMMQPYGPGSENSGLIQDVLGHYGRFYPGVIMTNGSYDYKRASAVVEEGKAALVSFGRAFIANPDLPERFRRNLPLAEADRSTYYAGEERGYTDYPALPL